MRLPSLVSTDLFLSRMKLKELLMSGDANAIHFLGALVDFRRESASDNSGELLAKMGGEILFPWKSGWDTLLIEVLRSPLVLRWNLTTLAFFLLNVVDDWEYPPLNLRFAEQLPSLPALSERLFELISIDSMLPFLSALICHCTNLPCL